MVKITGVEKDSLAYRHGIREGDLLVSVNRREIDDVLDYRFRMSSKLVVLKTERNGRPRHTLIVKDEYDYDIGLSFDSPLMDSMHSCRNKCIFCFIDQNPKGMRDSIYFKDDDSRMSFLQGNYITLTNLSEKEVARIAEMHISPVYVSVHTTNPELRCKMLNNRFAGDTLKYLRSFADAGIKIRAQAVLCRGINDGAELDRTMNDLLAYLPSLESVSIVPVGLTKHRRDLYPLEPYTAEDCAAIVKQVTDFGDMCIKAYGQRIFYAADEFYVMAGLPLPEADFYEDSAQLEDGIGMLSSFKKEAYDALEDYLPDEDTPYRAEDDLDPVDVSVVTGMAAYSLINEICSEAMRRQPGLKINVIPVKNRFYGETVTVAGLLTAQDILAAVKDKHLGTCLLYPKRALNAGGELFLDGVTPEEFSQKLGLPARHAGDDGFEFVEAILGI